MVCKENNMGCERESEEKENREGEWKEGKTGAERQEKHRALGVMGQGNFLAPFGFLIPNLVPRSLNFLYFCKLSPYPCSN